LTPVVEGTGSEVVFVLDDDDLLPPDVTAALLAPEEVRVAGEEEVDCVPERATLGEGESENVSLADGLETSVPAGDLVVTGKPTGLVGPVGPPPLRELEGFGCEVDIGVGDQVALPTNGFMSKII
jgi:hypothetical protein